MSKYWRTLWGSLIIGLCVVGCSVFSAANYQQTNPVSPAVDPYVEQVQTGVQYLQKRAQEQLTLSKNLLAALKSGDINRAKSAYVAARAPYEEIEVLAASFPEEDEAIDARPYHIDGGETSENYISMHRIESLIYRDHNLAAAVPYGEKLVTNVQSLIQKLNDPKNFHSSLNFAGMLTLAEEVPSKKISSEEETWSDQTILIFRHNWIGIQSQFDPYKTKLPPALVAEVVQAYQDCMASIADFVLPGTVQTKPYSTVNVQQRAKIVAAAYRYRDALAKAKAALKIPDPPKA